jgi:hypothetical protein
MIIDVPLPIPTQRVCEVCMNFTTLNAFKTDATWFGYGMLIVGVVIGFVLPKAGVYCWRIIAKRQG